MMSDWKPKRFWKTVAVVENDGEWAIQLDGREVKTPAKAPLRLKSKRLAHAVAEEWEAQVEKVDPNTMPVTRSANSAIDKLSVQRKEVVELLAAYGETDLLCYRAASPQELVERQASEWGPIIDWAQQSYGIRLAVGVGVMHVPQPKETIATLSKTMDQMDDFALAAFHDLVCISGSLLLALAVAHRRISAEQAWNASRVDESWQEEQWGVDEAAADLAMRKNTDFLKAAEIYFLANSSA